MKRLVAILCLGSAAMCGIASTAGTAVASSPRATRGGTVRVFDYGDGAGAAGTVVLTGAIGDFGTSAGIDANGTVDPQNNSEVNLALTQGSFRLSIVGLSQKIGASFSRFRPNPTTCSGYVSATAKVPVVAGSGTGTYAGISGSFTLTFEFAIIGPKLKSGRCNGSSNAPTLGSAQLVTGSGTVSFG